MKFAPCIVALMLSPLVALSSMAGPTRGGAAAPATPQATPTAACARLATPAAAPRGTPAPVEELTAADFALITTSVTVCMTDHGFVPRAFEYAVGHEVEATLVNTTSRAHTFTIDNLDIDVAVPAGAARKVTIPPANYGEHPFHSRAPGDEGAQWTGLLRVYL